jgi:uncharacterized protein
MRVFITGGTGLIGRRLVRKLAERGDVPVVLTRQADRLRLDPEMRGDPALRRVEVVQGDPSAPGAWDAAADGCDAVVNLAGQNLFGRRWNSEVKRMIRDSRVYGTENVVEAIRKAKNRPKVLVQASAIGFYGPHGDEELTESSPSGTDFMARVCREWEEAAWPAQDLGARVAAIRTGIVLAKGAGTLGVMTPIFKWLPGGAAPVGSGGRAVGIARGEQWMSWIHIDDIVGLFLLALDHDGASGPINGTAPQPERNKDFSRALAKAVHRPFLPIGPPDLVMNAVLGEVAQVVTKGQKVMPVRAKELGYQFQFPDLAGALRDLFAKAAPPPRPEPIPAAAGAGHGH